MTKTEITTALNSFISAVGKITKVRHTNANTLLVNELYSEPVVDISTNETFTTKSGSNFYYDLFIVKVGKVAQITARITNVSGVSQNAQAIFAFKENQYKPKTAFNPIKIRAFSNNGAILNLTLTSSGLVLNSGTAPNGTLYEFTFTTYITEI
jgi:hypothetical protein